MFGTAVRKVVYDRIVSSVKSDTYHSNLSGRRNVMQTVKTTLITIAVTGMLGVSLAVLADSTKGKSFEGVVVKDAIAMEQFPTEVQSGSIRIKGDEEQTMAGLASIRSSGATAIATRAFPGKVVETKLDNENGFLIWEVEVIASDGQESVLKIDAGNGRLLAAETEARENDEDHEDRDEGTFAGSSEDNDNDEHQDRD